VTPYNSQTIRYTIPEGGNVFVTCSRNPTRVNVHCSKAGGVLNVLADRLGAICGQALRGGVPANKLATALIDTRHDRSQPRRNGEDDEYCAYSLADAVGMALLKGAG
jgi:hypothetical protein